MAVNTKAEVRKQEKRRPFGVKTGRLQVNQEVPGFHLRWINDEPGRLHLAQESAYSFVTPEEVGRAPTDDNKVKELVGVQRDGKNPMYAYLMKVPEEFYIQDREAVGQIQDQFDDAIRSGQYERRAGDGRYIPEGGIIYKTK